MSIIVCLGETPDTYWQASNDMADLVLDRAQELATDEEAREAIAIGQAVHTLFLYEMASPLKERVWQAVEEAARQLAAEALAEAAPKWDWHPATQAAPRSWADHVGELAREMEARRLDPGRPGAWP